ncbi:unnamed protein product, partial [Scytosiphon promiscuus]
MIDPLRFRSLQDQLEFDENNSPLQCWQCARDQVMTPAFFLCHDCGKNGDSRPYCEPCFFNYHRVRKRGKDGHKPHPIVQGDPVIVQTLADGDGATFAKMHDWVTLDYTLMTNASDVVVEDTFLTKQPLTFQSGCSGPCAHLQLLGGTEIAAADILGASDPYCAVYWKDVFVGVTTTKHMTLNPKWANQTFVLPLAAEFVAALEGKENFSTFFDAGALLPKLRIELYDWDRLSKNDFLGQASVSDAEILRILRRTQSGETDENDAISFDLKARQSRGRMGLRVALRGSKLYVHVMQAENLPKADPFSLSDPYCEVYWNDKKVGKTAHIDDTLDPAWDLEIFPVRIDKDGPDSIEQSTLRVVCFDWDQFGSDDVLGQIELKGWQIMQLAENGKEAVGADERPMEEADMEKVFEFIQTFQEHEMNEARLGKMIVEVPQDPTILKLHDDGNNEAATVIEAASETERKETAQDRMKSLESGVSDIAPTSPGDKLHSGVEETGKCGEAKSVQDGESSAGPVVVRGADHESCAAEPTHQGGETNGVDEVGQQLCVERQKVVALLPPTLSEEKSSPSDPRVTYDHVNKETLGAKTRDREGDPTVLSKVPQGHEIIMPESGSNQNAGANRVVPLQIQAPGGVKVNTGQADTSKVGLDIPTIDAPEVDAESKAGDKILMSTGHRDDKKTLGLHGNTEGKSARNTNAQNESPAADVEEGDGRVEQSSAKIQPEVGRKATVRKSAALRYREASVHRFEEDRGILVEYMDDGTSAWVETKFVPRLLIRTAVSAPRNVFQRLWDQRKKLLNLHNRVLNVKRGMKVLKGIAMAGSRMQWFQLGLTDEQSGANFVRGTVDCRFLYHTRGSVLRGLDVAVSHMSLGERARVEVRADYGFGEVYAARKVPPYSTLVFVAQVAAIGHRDARWLILRRTLKDRVDDALFRFRSYVWKSASLFGALRRSVGRLRSLRKGRRATRLITDDKE